MSELHDLVDEIVDAVFDGTRQDTPAAIAAKEVAAQIMTGQTRRADLVAAIARLVHAVNLELAYREEMRALHSGPSLEEQLAAEPAPTPAHVSAPPPSHPEPKPTPRPLRDAIFRRYREVPIVHAPAGRGDPNQTLLGDPAPGRSALDQRNGEYL
ncbi:hypothetical protein [Stappia sp. ES.058]|uniref:hypothetical protein n=1 Tax=Stappia sp. ES.058 TaxID=1881061 RepID=UPI00087A5865|nr:hypothetical protein [Stappia sp. ES.058]SDU09026.1 hypothetical protein SAMN05428979_1562 [Stappia sp. ES.058]